jgi:hypothetical protein
VKRGTLEHRKLIRLASLLSAERPTDLADALGIIEAICNHFAPRSTPQGDIGKCSDSEIAIGIRTSHCWCYRWSTQNGSIDTPNTVS